MKAFKRVLIVMTLILVVLTAGVFVLLRSFDVNEYLPQITAEAKKVLGREVKIGSAALALSWSGIVLELKDIVLEDDPKFSDKPFLNVGRIRVGVNVPDLVLYQKVKVGEVVIVAPRVVIIRSKEGLINAATIGPKLQPTAVSAVAGTSADKPALVTPALPALLINDLRVTGASVLYVDETFAPKLSLALEDIDVNAHELSLTAPFDVTIKAAFADGAIDIKARVSDLFLGPLVDAGFDVGGVNMKKVSLALNLPFTVTGTLAASGNIKFSGKGPEEILASLNGDASGKLKDGILEDVNLLAMGFDKIPMLPGLLDSIMPGLPAATQDDVKKGITRFTVCEAKVRVLNGMLQVDAGDVITDDMAAHVTGSVKLVESLELAADIRVVGSLSGHLASRVKELSLLQDEQGRIHVPVNITGAITKPTVMPDLKYLTRKLAVAIGGAQLQKALGSPEAAEAIDAIFGLFKK